MENDFFDWVKGQKPTEKHLQGQHNQATHGGRGGGAPASAGKPASSAEDSKHTAMIKTLGESLYNPQMAMTNARFESTLSDLKKTKLSPQNKKLIQHVEDFQSGKTTLGQFTNAIGAAKKAGVPISRSGRSTRKITGIVDKIRAGKLNTFIKLREAIQSIDRSKLSAADAKLFDQIDELAKGSQTKSQFLKNLGNGKGR